MARSGGPCRSLRIVHAYILEGTWPSGGISPISYRSLYCSAEIAGAATPLAMGTTLLLASGDGTAPRDRWFAPAAILVASRARMPHRRQGPTLPRAAQVNFALHLRRALRRS